MKVRDLLLTYDNCLFEYLVIEFRENNFKIQTMSSKSID